MNKFSGEVTVKQSIINLFDNFKGLFGANDILNIKNGGTGASELSNVTVGGAINDGKGNNIYETYIKNTDLIPKKIYVNLVADPSKTIITVLKSGNVVSVNFDIPAVVLTKAYDWTTNLIATGLPIKSSKYYSKDLYFDVIPGVGAHGLSRLRITADGQLQLNLYNAEPQLVIGTITYFVDN